MIWNMWIFQVQACYTMKGIELIQTLKQKLCLYDLALILENRMKRSNKYAPGMNTISWIVIQCLQEGPFEAIFRIQMPDTVYFCPQKLQVQWGTENTKRITLRGETAPVHALDVCTLKTSSDLGIRAEPLAVTFNLLLPNKTYPAEDNSGCIILVYKPGIVANLDNYSLLSFCHWGGSSLNQQAGTDNQQLI